MGSIGQHIYDVIIVGGGPAGSATALSFMRSQPSAACLLIDNANPSAFKIGESLPANATRILAYLDTDLPQMLEDDINHGVHVYCMGNASIWASETVQVTDALMNPYGMGVHLDRASFDEALRESVRRAGTKSQRSHVAHAKFTGVEKKGDEWMVTVEDLDGGTTISYHSKWLIDATGRKASVAKKLGSKTVKEDALLSFYVVFSTSDDNDNDHRTLIEATESGWFYTCQLPRGRRIVAYHTDDRNPTSRLARRLDSFLQLLHTATTYVSSIIQQAGYEVLPEPGVVYPGCTAAGSSHIEPSCDEEMKWCAVGDAAIAFDPLSSQGMITALRMGSKLGLELSRVLSRATLSDGKYSTQNLQAMMRVYDAVRKDYGGKKAYYYGQVERFGTEFWSRTERTGSLVTIPSE